MTELAAITPQTLEQRPISPPSPSTAAPIHDHSFTINRDQLLREDFHRRLSDLSRNEEIPSDRFVRRVEEAWQSVKEIPRLDTHTRILITLGDKLGKRTRAIGAVSQLVAEFSEDLATTVPTLKRGYFARIPRYLALFNVHDTNLLNAVEQRVLRNDTSLRDIHLAFIADGFAELGEQRTELFETLLLHAYDIEEWSQSDKLIQFLAAYAITADDALFDAALEYVCRQYDNSGLPGVDWLDMNQLYHVVESRGRMGELPGQLQQDLENLQRLHGYKERPTTQNSFESAVGASLRTMDIASRANVPFKGYEIDFFVEYKGQEMILECDGVPFHYIGRDPDRGLLGLSRIKDAVLNRAGYPVARIADDHFYRSTCRVSAIAAALDKALAQTV